MRRDVLNRLRIVIAIGTTRIGLTKLTTKGERHARNFSKGLDPRTLCGDGSFTLHGLTGRIAIDAPVDRAGAARLITSSARVAKAERSELVLRCEI